MGAANTEPGGLFFMSKTADPKWQRRRLQVMERDNWTCQRCGNTSEQLEVHHLVYVHKAKYHEYLDHELITLCRECHQYETENIGPAITMLNYNVRTSGMLSDEIAMLADYHFYSAKIQRT